LICREAGGVVTKDEIDAALGQLTTWDLVGDYEGDHFMCPVEGGKGGEYVEVNDVRAMLESIDAARLAGREGE
jgi:hypothetical protein